MSVEENKAVVRRYYEALNAATADGVIDPNTAALDELASPEVAQRVRESMLPRARTFFGWHHYEITELVAEGDKVWARTTTSGAHKGTLFGVSPTGKTWTNRVVCFLRVADGKVVEQSIFPDLWNHAQQLGAALPPTAG
jgi:predicted ester cyclase